MNVSQESLVLVERYKCKKKTFQGHSINYHNKIVLNEY